MQNPLPSRLAFPLRTHNCESLAPKAFVTWRDELVLHILMSPRCRGEHKRPTVDVRQRISALGDVKELIHWHMLEVLRCFGDRPIDLDIFYFCRCANANVLPNWVISEARSIANCAVDAAFVLAVLHCEANARSESCATRLNTFEL